MKGTGSYNVSHNVIRTKYSDKGSQTQILTEADKRRWIREAHRLQMNRGNSPMAI